MQTIECMEAAWSLSIQALLPGAVKPLHSGFQFSKKLASGLLYFGILFNWRVELITLINSTFKSIYVYNTYTNYKQTKNYILYHPYILFLHSTNPSNPKLLNVVSMVPLLSLLRDKNIYY